MSGDARMEEPERLPEPGSPRDEESRSLDEDLDALPLPKATYPDLHEPEPDEAELEDVIGIEPPEHVEVELREPEGDFAG